MLSTIHNHESTTRLAVSSTPKAAPPVRLEPLEARRLLSVSISRDLSHQVDASAIFESYNSTGSIITDVSVTAFEGFDVSTGQPISKSASVGFTISKIDEVNGIPLIVSQGVSSSQIIDIDPSLKTAHVTALIPLVDLNGEGFTATIDLNWRATDAVQTSVSRSIDTSMAGTTILSQTVGNGDDAVASGTVRISANDFHAAVPNAAPLPSVSSSLQKVNSGTLTISVAVPAKITKSLPFFFSGTMITLDGADLLQKLTGM